MYAASIYSSSDDIDATIPFKCQRACKLNLLCSVTFFLIVLIYVQLYLILAWRRRLARSDSISETSNYNLRNSRTRETDADDGLAIKVDWEYLKSKRYLYCNLILNIICDKFSIFSLQKRHAYKAFELTSKTVFKTYFIILVCRNGLEVIFSKQYRNNKFSADS